VPITPRQSATSTRAPIGPSLFATELTVRTTRRVAQWKRAVRKARQRQESPVDFLTQHFSLLGLQLQWWMPIVTAACAIYVMWLWLSGQLSR
jgi:hypothetical protein